MLRTSIVTIAIYLVAISTTKGQISLSTYSQKQELNSSGIVVPAVLSAMEQENLFVLAGTGAF